MTTPMPTGIFQPEMYIVSMPKPARPTVVPWAGLKWLPTGWATGNQPLWARA